jgi:hypothetical protein
LLQRAQLFVDAMHISSESSEVQLEILQEREHSIRRSLRGLAVG